MIQFNDVSLKFGEQVIYDHFNYTFETGKIYCIVGKSGCGKTTLLRIAAGLQRADSGSVLIDGQPVKRGMRQLFMMHQRYTNFPWKTVLDNVLLPLKLNDGKLLPDEIVQGKAMLDRVGLSGNENLYPHELSGGMNQRVALARVLVARPSVLLMDEPLSALDPGTRVQMQDLILELHKSSGNNGLIIMVTHDPDEARRMGDVTLDFNTMKKGGESQ